MSDTKVGFTWQNVPLSNTSQAEMRIYLNYG